MGAVYPATCLCGAPIRAHETDGETWLSVHAPGRPAGDLISSRQPDGRYVTHPLACPACGARLLPQLPAERETEEGEGRGGRLLRHAKPPVGRRSMAGHLADLPRAWQRLAVALAAALLGAWGTWVFRSRPRAIVRDFEQLWYAARAILDGRNPYAEICPGCPFDWTHFYYPLTAAVAAIPIAPLPALPAMMLVSGLGFGCFTWALTRERWGPLVGLASASVLHAVEAVQWSPIFAAASVLPWLAVLYAAKPTIAVAFWLAWPRWRAVWGGLALLAISLAFQSDWPWAWRDALTTTALSEAEAGIPYLAPIGRTGGVLALLALARWRRPEARLVAALACVPQTPLLYESVALFLVAETAAEAAVLVVGSWLVVLWLVLAGPFVERIDWYTASGLAMVWCLYVPCLAIIWRRPNEGALPAWLERAVSRAPAWIRGQPASEPEAA